MIIPDPEQPERLALDGDGNLLHGIRIRRIDNPDAPLLADLNAPDWQHVGWSRVPSTSDDAGPVCPGNERRTL